MEDRKICHETLVDTVVGYAFTIKLDRHYENKSLVMIHVSITHEKENIGNLNGLIIDRDFRPRSHFHELCDSESQELQGMGVCFCNDDGTLRYKTLDGLTEEQDGAASSGGFLQIEQVSIDEAHRHKDLGIRCIKTLLQWLNVRDARERQEHKQADREAIKDLSAGGDMWARLSKPEYHYLHAGWSLAVIQPGLLNTREDHDRMREKSNREMAGRELSAEDQAREDERMAQQVIAIRKMTQQWARLGFTQAKFGSKFWHVTPSRLGLKTKEEVSDLQISEVPKRKPTAQLDKPLIDYIKAIRDTQPDSFEANVHRLLANGANLDRSNALIFAVLNGVRSEAQLRLLVRMGADPNSADEGGFTALHATASRVNLGVNEESAAVAAKTLIGLGASLSVKDVCGKTPLEIALGSITDSNDMLGCFGLLDRYYEGRDEEKDRYQLVLALLDPAERAVLIIGVLTPRQHHRLRFYIEFFSNEARNEAPDFEKSVPRPSDDMFQVPLWDHIPKSVRGEEVYKSFVYGWIQILEAIQSAFNIGKSLPTIDAVMRALQEGCNVDNRYNDFFFRNGGKIEFALDGLLRDTEKSEYFFEWVNDDVDDTEELDEYNALPEHPLDDCWDLVRYHFLGPRGKVPKGPYYK